eukprot:scaffold152654_cov32-Tisochrysis_lutea.AAC.3
MPVNGRDAAAPVVSSGGPCCCRWLACLSPHYGRDLGGETRRTPLFLELAKAPRLRLSRASRGDGWTP